MKNKPYLYILFSLRLILFYCQCVKKINPFRYNNRVIMALEIQRKKVNSLRFAITNRVLWAFEIHMCALLLRKRFAQFQYWRVKKINKPVSLQQSGDYGARNSTKKSEFTLFRHNQSGVIGVQNSYVCPLITKAVCPILVLTC